VFNLSELFYIVCFSLITLVIAKYRPSAEPNVDSRNYFSTLTGQQSLDVHPWQMQKVDVCQHEYLPSPQSFSPVLLPSSSANTSRNHWNTGYIS